MWVWGEEVSDPPPPQFLPISYVPLIYLLPTFYQSIAKEHDHYQEDLNQTMSHALDQSRLSMTNE